MNDTGRVRALLSDMEAQHGRTFIADSKVARASTTITAGALVRRQLRALINAHCSMFRIVLDLREEKGWLSSEFALTVEGEYKRVVELFKKIENLAGAVK